MPIIGFKMKFKNYEPLKNNIFTINFKLKYNNNGSLKFDNIKNSYFDMGDYHILLDEVFNKFDKKIFAKYDNGILILSVCKYLIDNIPNIYSISYQDNSCIDTYLAKEIIRDYNKIKRNK